MRNWYIRKMRARRRKGRREFKIERNIFLEKERFSCISFTCLRVTSCITV